MVAPSSPRATKYPRRGRFCGWVTAFATEAARPPYSTQKCIYPILRWGGIIFSEIRGGMVPLRHYGAAMKTTGNSNWRIASVALLCAAALSASAITQEDWEANPTLIPTPSATSEFYVTGTAPTDSTGEQSVSAEMTGLDATPNVRVYEFQFQSWLRTVFRGLYFILR